MNKVDAVGYLDAIEKVAQDTVVVVCIYDEEVRITSLYTLPVPTPFVSSHVLTNIFYDLVSSKRPRRRCPLRPLPKTRIHPIREVILRRSRDG